MRLDTKQPLRQLLMTLDDWIDEATTLVYVVPVHRAPTVVEEKYLTTTYNQDKLKL